MNSQSPQNAPAFHSDSWDRLSAYAAQSGRILEKKLGWGWDGIVYSTTSKTALKAYGKRLLYETEKNVYLRLQHEGIVSVGGFAVPELMGFDDHLLVIEMTIVSPPYILDFAGAYLDRKPPFDEEQWAEWEAEKIEQFGEDRWDEVSSALSCLRGYGIYLSDVKPGNVSFRDSPA